MHHHSRGRGEGLKRGGGGGGDFFTVQYHCCCCCAAILLNVPVHIHILIHSFIHLNGSMPMAFSLNSKGTAVHAWNVLQIGSDVPSPMSDVPPPQSWWRRRTFCFSFLSSIFFCIVPYIAAAAVVVVPASAGAKYHRRRGDEVNVGHSVDHIFTCRPRPRRRRRSGGGGGVRYTADCWW